MNRTLRSYDTSNRAIRKTYADQHYQAYSYSGGLLSATQNEKGQVTNYQYNDDGKLTTIDYPTMHDVTFSYDGLDRLSSMTDGLGTTNYTYNDLNQLTSVGGLWQNDNVSYSYDNLGRRTGMSAQLDASNSDNTSYSYDDLSRLSSIISGAGTFGYSYVGNSGLLNQVDLPNGEKSTFTYDALERLTQIQNVDSSANISNYSYAYDNTNHLPSRVSETSQVGTDDSIVRNYGYDPVDELISETATQNDQNLQTANYTYDPMGNRSQKTYQNGNDPLHTVSYTNNSLNQTTGTSNTDGTTTKQNAFTYDANGNTTQITGSDNSATQYTYDDADRLSSIVYKNAQGVNVSKSTFVYDGLSRLRISQQYNWDTQASAWVQQSEKRRIYDGMDVAQERDGNNDVTNSYTRNGNIGGILAMIHYTPDGSGGFTSDKYFYHYDGRGNVTQLTNDSQNIVAKYTYDASGNTTASGSGAELNQYRFSTKEEIKGLYYYGYRFYSPGLGKWINRDPIQEAGGINLYEFVGNSPITNIDNYGHVTLEVVAIGAVAGALTNIAGQILGNSLSGRGMWCIDWAEVGIAALAGAISALEMEGVPVWLSSAIINMVQTAATKILVRHKLPTPTELQAAAITGAVGGGFGQVFGNVGDFAAKDLGDTVSANAAYALGSGASGLFSNTFNTAAVEGDVLCPHINNW